MTLFIVLPAYNEYQAISPLFTRLRQFEKKSCTPIYLIFVDDGSTDGTSEIAIEKAQVLGLSMNLIQHIKNAGRGQAIKTGLTAFIEIANEDDCVATIDCDNTQPPELLDIMYELITRDNYDITIASRYQKGSSVVGLSIFRVIMSYGASILFQVLLPIPRVKDYTCGFRAYKASFLRKLFNHYGDTLFSEDGFACMVDLLLKSRPLKPKVAEVPMILRYDQKPTATKMKIFRTVFQTVKLLIKRKTGVFD
ncbi:MAG: glycosyltransferase family 2 protein [Pseudanabaena sp.]|jgi:dolichol-phosphate mannosyltransferase